MLQHRRVPAFLIRCRISPRHGHARPCLLIRRRRPFDAVRFANMDGITPKQKPLERIRQGIPRGCLADPQRITATGRKGLSIQNRAGWRPFQEAEIRMPVAAKDPTTFVRPL